MNNPLALLVAACTLLAAPLGASPQDAGTPNDPDASVLGAPVLGAQVLGAQVLGAQVLGAQVSAGSWGGLQALLPDDALSGHPSALPSGLPSGRDWLLKTSDNVCGLRDPNQLTYPALIDFDGCLNATPEMTRLRDQGIDPKSAEGIQLRSAAVTRLTDACEAVRSANGHCSVWKAIRHKDGRSIPDVSTQVIAQF